jgi:hypothetical protein
MSSSKRRVQQHPMPQGTSEVVAYTLTTTPWGGSPSAPVVTVLDVTDSPSGTDVTATVCSGSASVSGDVITTPLIRSLTQDHIYHLFVRWTAGGETLEAWAEIRAER